uniref:DUF5641 domain-containing protein n=1 Tax=Bombyx mori TaxID=7091 RepID=A0A8R2M277_BOMMO|nr:uncharacterized protein LOC119629562 [Bombyx mori]
MSTEKLMIPEKSPKSPISKSNDPLSILIKKRGIIRGRLTVLTKQINSLDQNSLVSCANKRAELELRLSTASKMFDEFSEIQSEIELSVNDHDLFQQLELREGFESAYYTIIAQAKSLLSSSEVAPSSHPGSHAVKLPTIAMPTFDGSYEHWLEYRDTFLSLVHNNADITPIQKFHYLKSSLKSVAALVIDSLEFSSNNYTVAWDLICNRYNNTRLLVHNHVKALFSIQSLVKESPTHIRDIVDYATSQNITFKFIPPYAPHFGGLWEAGVKSFGRPLTAPVCADLQERQLSSLTRYQRVEQIRQHFWNRWSKEYVSEMQTRTKWKSNHSDLKLNTLVVIKDTNSPPLKWTLGRVTSVLPGQDGVSRVAEIRTATGTIKRAFSKICPLPVEV